MDKNTVIGIVLIVAMMIGFSYLNRPSEEELAAQAKQRKLDSIAYVQKSAKEEAARENRIAKIKTQKSNEVSNALTVFHQDSAIQNKEYTIENNLLKVIISSKGGMLKKVNLKKYYAQDSLPLNLWNNDKEFGLKFYAQNKNVNTADLYFTPTSSEIHQVVSDKAKSINLRLNYSANQYIEFTYTLSPDSYKVGYDIKVVGLENIIPRRTVNLDFYWKGKLSQYEKSASFENRYTGLYYKFDKDDVDYLSMSSDDKEVLETPVKWIAFKQQFFSSALIGNKAFTGVEVTSKTLVDSKTQKTDYLKEVGAIAALPYEGKNIETYDMDFYFGPNHYLTLKKYGEKEDLELTKLINLGWSMVSWFNRWVVIYLFNWLEGFIANYGIIILILTLLVKLVLFPLTWKSYVSSAKMRLVKPQIDEISKKYPGKDKAMEKQKATMALYKKAGINPMGGCLPMLLQMPILIALFYFFPSSIELRGQSFLWATDLSSYDSIMSLPFTIPFYGNHVSLFCLLMTVVNILYMRMNNKNQAQNDQMKGMQTMMYFMPIMFLFIFNNYSAGLSYYYFISTLITVLQTIIIRKTINDDKILARIEENSKRKVVKKSKFQERIEKLQKQAAQQQANKKK